jgi:DNA-binding PadR family transcriptional regulator
MLAGDLKEICKHGEEIAQACEKMSSEIAWHHFVGVLRRNLRDLEEA